MIVFEDHVSRPVGRHLRYLISTLLEDRAQRVHLGDVLDGAGLIQDIP